MSQTGYTPIQLYYSTTASNTPSVANLSLGELGINLADQKAYMLNSAGTAVVTLVGTLGNQNANSVSITGGSVNGTTIGATTASTGAFTTISATGVITSTVATGTAPFTIASTTQVANLNAATAGTATNATNTVITDNTSSSATWYPTIVSATTGNLPQTTSSTKLSFVPSTGTLTATSYGGAWAGSTIGTTYGGTGLTSFTANGVVYASSTSALSTGSALTFDGTTLAATASGIGAALKLLTTSANASARNWAIAANNQSYGDFVLLQSNALGGDPLTAGTIRMYGTSNVNQMIFGGGTSLAGAGSPLASVSSNNDYIFGGNNTNATDPYGIFLKYTASTPNGNGNSFFYFNDATALRARMQSNGGLANYSANNTNLSDRNEKTNFAPAKNYLDVICAIPVQTFNYIDQNLADDPGTTLGVIAQDVQTVAPELVLESNWGTKEEPKIRLSIYQTDLQYALMKCVQEIKQKLDDANARIAALESTK